MAPRHVNNARTGLKSIRNNPCFYVVRPTPVAPAGLNNLQPTHKSTSICHSSLQQK